MIPVLVRKGIVVIIVVVVFTLTPRQKSSPCHRPDSNNSEMEENLGKKFNKTEYEVRIITDSPRTTSDKKNERGRFS